MSKGETQIAPADGITHPSWLVTTRSRLMKTVKAIATITSAENTYNVRCSLTGAVRTKTATVSDSNAPITSPTMPEPRRATAELLRFATKLRGLTRSQLIE